MINFSKQSFLSITLVSLICLPLFANNLKNTLPKEFSEKTTIITPDIFQECMTASQDHAQAIAWVTQQLLLAIDAKKITLQKTDQLKIVKELKAIKEFTNNLLEKVLVQNIKENLQTIITTNHTLIEYLLHGLENNLKTISFEELNLHQKKRSAIMLPDEILLQLLHQNELNLQKLIYATGHVGLSWYNDAYRAFKSCHPYSIAKGVAIAAASAIFIGYIACQLKIKTDEKAEFLDINKELIPVGHFDCNDPKNGWFSRWVGQAPKLSPNDKKYFVSDAEGNPVFLKGFTPFQKLCMTSEALQTAGIISLGALINFNLNEIFHKLHDDNISWLKNSCSDKFKSFDKNLSGNAPTNIDKDGYEKVYFKDMVGCQELEELAKTIANFMKHPERYERSQIDLHRNILLFGPPQTGKTLFAKALRTLIADNLEGNKKINFIDAKKILDNHNVTIEDIFEAAAFHAPCIIFFDEIDLVGTHRDKNPWRTSQLLTCMQGVDSANKQIFVIGATNRLEQLDQALLVDGRFGKKIHIDYPKYEDRKSYLCQQLANRSVDLAKEYIDYIAQETDGCSYNDLKRIITEALLASSIQTRQVTQLDFENTLDKEVRKIHYAKAMSTKEKEIISFYQAGKAVARHLLQTGNVVKVTINPVSKHIKTTETVFAIKTSAEGESDNDKLSTNKKESKIKLGEVFTTSKINHAELQSDQRLHDECLSLLAGSVALEIMLNTSFTQCNKHDRAEAMQIIYSLIGGGEKITDSIRAQALEIKNKYEQEIKQLLSENKELITLIAEKLIAQNTINREEWKELVS